MFIQRHMSTSKLIHDPKLGRVVTIGWSWQAYIDGLQRRLACVTDIFQKPRVVGLLIDRHLQDRNSDVDC